MNEFLRLLFHGPGESLGMAGPVVRLARAADQGDEVATLPATDFHRWLVRRRLHGLRRQIELYQSLLDAWGAQPQWWAKDMQAYVRGFEMGMVGSDLVRLDEPGGASMDDPLDVLRTYSSWCTRCCGIGRRCGRRLALG